MNDEGETKLNTKGLDGLLKALKLDGPIAKIGVLGKDVTRHPKQGEKAHPNNALIGAIHEFGSSTHPQRSFLRVPIKDHLDERLSGFGLDDKDLIADVLKNGTFKIFAQKIAIGAVAIVAEAFATQGFGKWPAWKTPGYTNNTGQVLKDTQQLSESITWELSE